MIIKYDIQGKEKFVPKVRFKFLEWVANIGVYTLTKDPRKAERFSTRERAKKAIKQYKAKKIWQ